MCGCRAAASLSITPSARNFYTIPKLLEWFYFGKCEHNAGSRHKLTVSGLGKLGTRYSHYLYI